MEGSHLKPESSNNKSKGLSQVKEILGIVGLIIAAILVLVVSTWICTVIGFHPGPRSGLGTPMWFLGGASPYELIVNFMGW